MLLLTCCNIYGQVELKKQKDISRMGIPYGNYSGITHVEGNLYAIVSDKDEADGFHFLNIDINHETGKIKNVAISEPAKFKENLERVRQSRQNQRDTEGICYRKCSNSFFISGEADQQILEYSFEGLPTGKSLSIPVEFSVENINTNRGFEALTYNGNTHLFWTTTELPLKLNSDNTIKLQSFSDDLQPQRQFYYKIEYPLLNKKASNFVYGVPDLLALDDGRLIVMEREVVVTYKYLGSYCIVKLYIVNPNENIHESTILQKTLLAEFKTKLAIGKMNFANYEGICIGPKLNDGRQTIILINDSQNGEGNKLYRAKDYLKVIVLDKIVTKDDE